MGREQDLRQIASGLHVGSTVAIGQVEIAAATGLGGIGKTQLACEFVHRYGQYVAGGVFWLSFADPAVVPMEVAACGGADGMQLRPEFGILPLDEQVKFVLTAWESPIPRLLIFDNCEDEALLEQWRPKHGGCRVLLTSRRHHWDAALGVQALPLDVLARTDSLALLRTFRPDLLSDDPDLDAIATVLGDLPLALHLSGSFLANYRHAIMPAQYLQRLRVPTLLDDRSLRTVGLSPTQHVQHVARTFEQSYERLDSAEPLDALARTLLAQAACFAPGELIPRWLLLTTLAPTAHDIEGTLLAEDAVARLIDLGLVETDAMGNLRLHRLLVAFVRAVLVNDAAQAAVEMTMLQVAATLNEHRNPRPFLMIQPHLHFITAAAQPHHDARTARLSHALGDYMRRLGDYAEAQGHLQHALAIQERVLGLDHPDTAMSLNHLGCVLWLQGQYVEAQRCLEQAVAIRQRVLVAGHPDTARSLNNLGIILYERGHYVEAQHCLEHALALLEGTLGVDHPHAGIARIYVGVVLWKQGQSQAGQGFLEQAAGICRRTLGLDHPDSGLSLYYLGLILKDQGQYAAAQDYLEQARTIQEQVLGANHPDTARSLCGLGTLFYAQGDVAQARRYLEHALTIFDQRLGPHHPDTEKTRQLLTT